MSTKQLIKTSRIEWIDIAKGIGILFVVYGHVNYAPGLLGPAIYSFHMPLFFILSGMVFRKEKYPSFLQYFRRESIGLLCPYVLFYLLSFLYEICSDVVQNGISSFETGKHMNYFIQMFVAQNSHTVVNAPLWFVPCIFVVKMIYYFVSKLKTRNNILLCCLLVCCGWIIESDYMPIKNVVIPWSVDSALFALGFYALGNLSIGKVQDTLKKMNNYMHVGVAIFCTICVLIVAYVNGIVSLGSKVLSNGFLTYISGIVGTCGIISLSVLFSKSRFLRYCGQNSFCIMATHYIIRNLIGAVNVRIGIRVYDANSSVETIIPFIIILSLSMLCTVIYNKTKKIIKI